MAKTVLITGCSSGIGYATALGLHQAGYRVFASTRSEADLQRLSELGLESLHVELEDSLSIRRAVQQVLAATGGSLDILINNAAYALPGAVEDLSRDALRAQFEVNVFGCIELIQQIIPVMRAQGQGRIIQMSSILGLVTMPFRGAYCASKYAIESFGDALRMELKGSGIHLILIEPGPIQSQFRRNAKAAFEKNVSGESVHQSAYQRLYQQEATEIAFSLQPEAVLQKIQAALKSSHPKVRYYVTVPAYFMMWARRLLPKGLLDILMEKLGR